MIGVGKALGLPSLRTVRAVFPHTALQSLVSSSGMSRVFKRCCKGEQSLIREEGVRPSLMVGFASSEPRPLVLLAQDGTQPPPNETIKAAELEWRGVLEIAEPSPQRRIEVRNDPREAVTSAAVRFGPHLVLDRYQALLSHQPATRLEPVAEEFESLSRLSAVDDPRLVRMQHQAVLAHPSPHQIERRFGLDMAAGKNDE